MDNEMNGKSSAAGQFLKTMRWAAEYPDLWEAMCNADQKLSDEQCNHIINSLRQHGLCHLIPILLYKNEFAKNYIIGVWEQEGKHNRIEMLEETLREWEKIMRLRTTEHQKDRRIE